MEGYAAREIMTIAKQEGMNIAEQWQDLMRHHHMSRNAFRLSGDDMWETPVKPP